MPEAYLLRSYAIAKQGGEGCLFGRHSRPKLWLGSYRPTRDQDPPAQRQDALALLVDGPRLDVDHPPVALGRGRRHLQDLRLGVDRVAVEGGAEMHHLLVLQVGERVLADVAHAHADGEREHERAVHEAAAVLALAGEVLVEVQRVGVHGEEREPGVVEVADGAPRPVLDHLAHAEVFEVAPHGASLSGIVVEGVKALDRAGAARYTRADVAGRGKGVRSPRCPAAVRGDDPGHSHCPSGWEGTGRGRSPSQKTRPADASATPSVGE